MDKHELTLRKMFLEQPYEKWPLLAKAMAWQRGTDGPPWMSPEDREWFWATLDYETAKAEKQAVQDAAWERVKADLMAPFVRVVEWLARRKLA